MLLCSPSLLLWNITCQVGRVRSYYPVSCYIIWASGCCILNLLHTVSLFFSYTTVVAEYYVVVVADVDVSQVNKAVTQEREGRKVYFYLEMWMWNIVLFVFSFTVNYTELFTFPSSITISTNKSWNCISFCIADEMQWQDHLY